MSGFWESLVRMVSAVKILFPTLGLHDSEVCVFQCCAARNISRPELGLMTKKKQRCNKLYFIPMRFLFFWNAWDSLHHVSSVTWMKLVKWNTKVRMFLENRHFDQQINLWIVKPHRPYLSTFPNTKNYFNYDMLWSGYVGQTWRCLEMWQNTYNLNNCLIYLFKTI